MYLNAKQPMTLGFPGHTYHPILAIVPAFGELINTLGELWEVSDDFSLEVRNLRLKDSFGYEDGTPYAILTLLKDGMPENTHPRDLGIPWIQLLPSQGSIDGLGAKMECYVGRAQEPQAFMFSFPSIYKHALTAAHHLFKDHIDKEKVNEISVFNMNPPAV